MPEVEVYKKWTYYALALDPIHVGAGGYRLGRVDNTIAREPGTNLPKIPGTSLCGAARAYTAMATPEKYRRGADGSESCAGKGGSDGTAHCGENGCPVCLTYGFSRPDRSFQGLAQFFDARILFFPVYSAQGPVWVVGSATVADDQVRKVIFGTTNESRRVLEQKDTKLNLGWLLLDKGQDFPAQPLGLTSVEKIPTEIRERAVVVSPKVFSRLVNDNLEVRTSVAIDPATGAAEDGALYSYEAIPRSTVLWFDVVFNKPRHFTLGGEVISTQQRGTPATWGWVRDNVEKGLGLMEFLGVGGMGTRGMGRLKILNPDTDQDTDAGEPAPVAAARTGGGPNDH